MYRVRVDINDGYDVIIGNNLNGEIAAFLKGVRFNGKIAIITDDVVSALYLKPLYDTLTSNRFNVKTFQFMHGESQKNFSTYEKIAGFLIHNEFTRDDLIIALGGGVVGDIAGFAAATFMRGIRFINVSTTLLSMVDASVGGKNAIDVNGIKNVIGTFYQPIACFTDLDYLKTLDEKEFACGMAEIIKMSVLKGGKLREIVSLYLDKKDEKTLEEIIYLSIEGKNEYVTADEKEKGVRTFLNLGHTVGHAIEKCSDYKISHGEAVSIGLNQILKISKHLTNINEETKNLIRNLLIKAGLPVNIPGDLTVEDIFEAVRSDKKRHGDTVSLILVSDIGDCIIKTIAIEKLKGLLEKEAAYESNS